LVFTLLEGTGISRIRSALSFAVWKLGLFEFA